MMPTATTIGMIVDGVVGSTGMCIVVCIGIDNDIDNDIDNKVHPFY